MSVTVLAVGKLGERHWSQAAAEYQKRLTAFCKFSLLEIPEAKLPTKPSPGEITKALEAESKAILDKLPPKAYVITLCVEGKAVSSEGLALCLEEAAARGSRLALVIGGSHGLSGAVKERSHLRMSMSAMTFPHQLARIMALEQLYRAFSISSGLPYHK